MEPCVLLIVLGVLLAVTAVFLRGSSIGVKPLPPRAVYALIGAALLTAGGLVVATAVLPRTSRPAKYPSRGSEPGELSTRATVGCGAEPLAAGAKAPPVVAEGWLNGQPVTGARVTVVDIWVAGMTGCREPIPGLVQLFEKYKDRGVAFVGLTNMRVDAARHYVSQHSVPWPCGYSAGQTMVRFGALGHDGEAPDTDVDPILFVLASDGTVRWNDHRSRLQSATPSSLLTELEAQIERALADRP